MGRQPPPKQRKHRGTAGIGDFRLLCGAKKGIHCRNSGRLDIRRLRSLTVSGAAGAAINWMARILSVGAVG